MGIAEKTTLKLGLRRVDFVNESALRKTLNHANTVSVEDNLRKRSYNHSPANGTVTATTSLLAWCRDNRRSVIVVA
jgi:hypothetical protein